MKTPTRSADWRRGTLLILLLACLISSLPAVAVTGDATGRGFFGLTPRVTDKGVTVVAVSPGGPAERAGVREGDVVLLLEGTPPETTPAGGVVSAFAKFHVGDQVELVVRRGETVETLRITLGKVPPPTREEQAHAEAIERRAHAAQVVDEMFRTLDEFELTFSKDDRLMFRESADQSWRVLEPEVAKTFEAVTRHFLREKKIEVLRLKVVRREGKEPELVPVDP